MTPEALRTELSRGEIRCAYLIAGEERLFRDEALEALRAAVLEGGPADFNFDRIDGDVASVPRLLDSVRSLPVLAPRRLVVLREPEPRRGGAQALTDAIVELVDELRGGDAGPASTVLVVTAAGIDRRARWVRAFQEPAVIVDCAPPRGARAVLTFVRDEARRQGLRLEPGVAELLAERVGARLLMLRNELAKAALTAGEDGRVTRAQVAAATGDVAEEPIWDLTDAIGEGRAADALSVLSKLLRSGAPPVVVLGSVANHFRKLARLRDGGRVAGHPFAIRKLEKQVSRYGSDQLLGCLRSIYETDAALKGQGALPPVLALERLVLNLAG